MGLMNSRTPSAEHFLVQGQIRHQPAQPGAFLLQLPEFVASEGIARQTSSSSGKKFARYSHLATGDLGHLSPLLGLLQGKANLLLGKPGPFHRENPPCQIGSSWQNSLIYELVQFSGSRGVFNAVQPFRIGGSSWTRLRFRPGRPSHGTK